MDGLFVITGGGTGGHLFPGLAVAFEARRREPDQRILYVSRESAEERERVEQHGFEFKGLTVRGLSRRRIHRNIKILYEHAKATLQMKGILSASARGAVLGVGGYASAPAVLAARLARWPIVLHEQNSFPGVVTRWFSKHAAAVCTSFEESHPHLEGPKPVLTGMPVRPEIQPPDNWSRGQDIKKPPCILVLGGSQGARALVQIALDSIDHLDERNIEFRMILQTGQQNRDLVQGLPERGQIVTPAFIENMADAYKAADLLVCRAGAGTLAEAALWQLPALIVPLPTSAGDHQTTNARHFERARAARVLPQDELDGARLARAIERILGNESLWREMIDGMRTQARPGAAAKILDTVEQAARGQI